MQLIMYGVNEQGETVGLSVLTGKDKEDGDQPFSLSGQVLERARTYMTSQAASVAVSWEGWTWSAGLDLGGGRVVLLYQVESDPHGRLTVTHSEPESRYCVKMRDSDWSCLTNALSVESFFLDNPHMAGAPLDKTILGRFDWVDLAQLSMTGDVDLQEWVHPLHPIPPPCHPETEFGQHSHVWQGPYNSDPEHDEYVCMLCACEVHIRDVDEYGRSRSGTGLQEWTYKPATAESEAMAQGYREQESCADVVHEYMDSFLRSGTAPLNYNYRNYLARLIGLFSVLGNKELLACASTMVSADTSIALGDRLAAWGVLIAQVAPAVDARWVDDVDYRAQDMLLQKYRELVVEHADNPIAVLDMPCPGGVRPLHDNRQEFSREALTTRYKLDMEARQAALEAQEAAAADAGEVESGACTVSGAL